MTERFCTHTSNPVHTAGKTNTKCGSCSTESTEDTIQNWALFWRTTMSQNAKDAVDFCNYLIRIIKISSEYVRQLNTFSPNK